LCRFTEVKKEALRLDKEWEELKAAGEVGGLTVCS
jgi:hypothetical protein